MVETLDLNVEQVGDSSGCGGEKPREGQRRKWKSKRRRSNKIVRQVLVLRCSLATLTPSKKKLTKEFKYLITIHAKMFDMNN